MILAQLKARLRERGQVSLADLALHVGSDPDAVRGMLELWIRKGRVRAVQSGAACGGCTQCDPAANAVYQWIGDGKVSAPCVGAEMKFHAPNEH